MLKSDHILNWAIIHNTDTKIIDDLDLALGLIKLILIESIDKAFSFLRYMLFSLTNHSLIWFIILFFYRPLISSIYYHWLWASIQKFVYKLAVIFPPFNVYKISYIFIFFKFKFCLFFTNSSHLILSIRTLIWSNILEIFFKTGCFCV